MPIHPTAVVDRAAEIHPSADIGPHVVIDGPVRIGARTRILAGAYLTGRTQLGADNVVHPGAVIGHEPQDLAYAGAPTGLYGVVADGLGRLLNRHVQLLDEGVRVTERQNLVEAGQLHDDRHGERRVESETRLCVSSPNGAEKTFISGNCVVHQHCRVGQLAIMRGLSRASRDVPPFAIMDETHTVRGLNRIGLRRAGFDAARIRALATAFRMLFRVRTNMRQAMARVEAEVHSPDVDYLLAFMRASTRGVATGPRRGENAADEDD